MIRMAYNAKSVIRVWVLFKKKFFIVHQFLNNLFHLFGLYICIYIYVTNNSGLESMKYFQQGIYIHNDILIGT